MSTQTDTYQRIIDSAKELLYAKSYADVGVAAICEKANVQKGSFYHHFTSKQELTLAVIDNFYIEFKTNLIDRAFDARLPPLERLDRIVELAIEFQIEIHKQTGHILGCPFGNLGTEMATQDETIRCKLAKVFLALQSQLRYALQEAVDKGDLKDIHVENTAQGMLAMFEGVMLLAKTHNSPDILRNLLPAMAQIRLN